MFSSYIVDVNEVANYMLKTDAIFLKKALERKMTGEFLLYQKVR